jgi:hypothetical protein
MAVVRSFADMKHVVGLLQADRTVLIVVRTDSSERRRCLDFLAGWALGSGGDVDEISPNALLARPPGAPPACLARSEIVSSVEAVFEQASSSLDRAEEDRLVALASSGSDEARRHLTDFYSELAAVLALALRPAHKSQATAQREAQEELERIVAWPPRSAPLLVSLTNAIHERLNT